MFFGAATTTASAHHLLSLAADRGVNIFDTAEMYPVPQSAQHQGQSETTLGNWLKTQRRCNAKPRLHMMMVTLCTAFAAVHSCAALASANAYSSYNRSTHVTNKLSTPDPT